MDLIESFIAEVFANTISTPEIQKEKEEMYQHLIELVEDMIREGKSLTNAMNSAIEQFGKASDIRKELEETFGELFIPELNKSLTPKTLTFEDLYGIDKHSLGKIFYRVSNNETIAKALRFVPDYMQDRFFSCMSDGKREAVMELDETLLSVTLSDVKTAQTSILEIVRKMDRNNEIIL